MKFIKKTPNPSGAYPLIQSAMVQNVPAGCAQWPEDLSDAEFYSYNGYVKLTIEPVTVVVGQESVKVDGSEQLRDVTVMVDTVTACEPDVAAWEAWKATLPEPEPDPEPEPTAEEKIAALEAQVAEQQKLINILAGGA